MRERPCTRRPFPFTGHLLAFSLAAAGLAPLVVPLAAQAQSQPGARVYAIPAGPLESALNRFSLESGVMLAFAADDIAGKQSAGLSGSFAPPAALQALLAGTDLVAHLQPNGGYTVRKAAAPQSGPAAAPPRAPEKALPPVTVTASAEQPGELPKAYAGGQVARGARLGLLGNTDVMDAPFNITSYTAQAVQDQQARTISDMLARSDPSVRVTGGEGNDTDILRIRGFDVSMEDATFNGLPGLLSYYRSKVEFVERVEVLKGPSAMLSGMSPSGSIGGTVNVVPKRADDAPVTRLTTSYLSDSRFGLHGDVGRRFGENNEWGLRFNGALRQGDTARDYQKQDHQLGALALDYRGERLRASIDYLYQSMIDNASRTFVSFGTATGGIVPAPPSGDTNFTQQWTQIRSGNRTVATRVEYDLLPNLTAYATLGRSKGWFDGKGAGNLLLTSSAGDTRGSAGGSSFHLDTTAAEIGVGGRFATRSVAHQWAAAFSSVARESAYGFSPSAGAVISNIYSPIYSPEPAGIQAATAKAASKTRLPSLALADTLSFADDLVRFTAGVRHQTVKTDNFNMTTGAVSSRYDQSATTPFLGIVVKPWRGGSVYANAVNGLAQGEVASIDAVNAGETLPPYKTKQVELGVKQDWGGFGGSVSVFQIAKSVGLLDPVTRRFSASGEQRHRGLEVNVFGEPTRGLRLLGGASWIDAEISRSANPVLQGKRPIGVAEFTANLGADWDVPGAAGLSLNAAVIHTGSSYVDGPNAALVGGWTRTDVGARWATRIADRPVVFRASVENLFDRRYWSVSVYSGLYLGLPRTFLLSGSVDF